MFPGLTTKVSEATVALATTIYPQSDLLRVTDTSSTTVVATISPAFGGFGGILIINNESGAAITTVTTGNIATAVSIAANTATLFVYSQGLGKWIPGAVS